MREKGIFSVYSVYRIAIDILCIDSLLLRKNKLLQSGAGGQDTDTTPCAS